MGALVVVLGLCCAGLLSLAGLLWVMVRTRSDAGPAPTLLLRPRVFLDTKPVATPMVLIHPRMDLASGRVPPNQSVDLDRRRARWMVNASTSWGGRGTTFEPFAERKASPVARRQRLDLVYAREEMGDLSDPDIRPARPVNVADLDTVVRAS